MTIYTAIKKSLRKIPILDSYLKKRKFNKKYAVELALLENRPLKAGKTPSVIHFSINKAATQHVKKVLHSIALENDLVLAHYHGLAFQTGRPYLDHLSKKEFQDYKHIFRPRGFLYSVFGGMIPHIESLEKYRVLLAVRDPRDVLVSKYFSIAFSHRIRPEESGKREAFLEHRKKAQDMSIDEFVLDQCDKVKSIYMRYHNQLLQPWDHTVMLKYEEMTDDYERWLDRLGRELELGISKDLKQRLIEQNEQKKARREDKYHHVRKGKPGDHREKLAPETIKELNERLEKVLRIFGYA